MMKLVDGREVEMTADEIVQRQGEETAWITEEAARAAGIQRLQAIRDDALRQQLKTQFDTATNTEISQFVDNQVTDLASARTMFKRILLVLALIAR